MNKKEEDLANSEPQQKIQDIVTKVLEKKYNCNFSQQPKGNNYNLDLYNYTDKKIIIGEIYAGINNILSGPKKKVLADCFKLVYVEKEIKNSGYEGEIEKWIVFVDKNIESTFKKDEKIKSKSWIKDAIHHFQIKTITVEISSDNRNDLVTAKENQQKGNVYKGV